MYNKCFHIKEINNNIILFFYKSLEEIRKLFNMQRISISKYLNSIYNSYCDKSSINYKPIFKNSKQNIIAETSMNTKTDKIEKLSKTLLFPSSALG